MIVKDLNSFFSGVYLPAVLTRCSHLSAFAKLLFAHLAQHADSHNMVQLHFPFVMSELGFIDERELIATLDELESWQLILVQRGNSNTELIIANLSPDFTELLRARESSERQKRRSRYNGFPGTNLSQNRLTISSDRSEKSSGSEKITDCNQLCSDEIKQEVSHSELSLTKQTSLFPMPSGLNGESQTNTAARRKGKRKQPRSRHSLQDCWSFAQYQRRMNGAERIPTPDRFAVALYTTGQQDEEIDLFLLSIHQYPEPSENNGIILH